MESCVIAIDMGGTFIKYGIVDEKLSILCDGSVPADSHDSREVLLDRLSEAIDKGLKAANGFAHIIGTTRQYGFHVFFKNTCTGNKNYSEYLFELHHSFINIAEL